MTAIPTPPSVWTGHRSLLQLWPGLDPALPCLPGWSRSGWMAGPSAAGEQPWCLCELEVSAEAYEHLKQQLSTMYARREQYHYNLLGALSCYFHQPLRREHHYFCSPVCSQPAGGERSGGAGQMSRPGPPGRLLLPAWPALYAPRGFDRFSGLIRPVFLLFPSPDLTEPIPRL